MKLNDLKPAKGARKERRRVGRGVGSGRGKTSGRGQKGQKSRSGYSKGQGWEGGRSELIARLPKRGFTGRGPQYQIVNVGDLERFASGSTVTPEALLEAGLIRNLKKPVKLLGDGELAVKNLTVELDAYSTAAAEAVRRAGGTVKNLEPAQAQDQSETPAEEQG